MMDKPGIDEVFERAASGVPLSVEDAYALGAISSDRLPELLAIAEERRNRLFGRILTFSPKVFLPITNLCRNHCDYCTFRRSPGDPGEWTMTPDEIRSVFEAAREQGCVEALFCLGDTPETGFREYRSLLRGWGHSGTVDYLAWAGELALEHGLLPHTNAGILSRDEMSLLRRTNVSLGLMLENTSPRLCEKGMPHHKAPDKRPHKRIAMTREAGELGIPFTSGLLIGIGETRDERVATLLAIRELSREHGHVQEVIVQNFRTKPDIPMANAPEPDDLEMAHTIALARLVLDDEVSVQAPPNLNGETTSLLVRAGINDFGGISPVTPDYINPQHPWPHLEGLAADCDSLGFRLAPRLPVYDRYLHGDRFLDPRLRPHVESARTRLSTVSHVADLSKKSASRPHPPVLDTRSP